ncbi:MAG: PadR family transcriptional regulator [Rhodospirillum sp.]|nr:PadR family transcriptional regulator [Rhodospirillum sp.]MCF8492042.1 PadR family transcriptional regulator [Rhodospirillum sp.]MCF8501850.1 PadR family transcriptional regulator [Rhodospirillum sp.]
MMDAEELRLVLLSLLADQPRHGYDLIRGIEDLTGGAYAPSPGVVYPALSLLADMSLVEEAESGGPRKVFVITQAGTADLTEKADQVEAVLARLKALANDEARVDVTPVRRAMENLRTVLKTRLIREDSDKDMVHDIAARLDALAQDVERL